MRALIADPRSNHLTVEVDILTLDPFSEHGRLAIFTLGSLRQQTFINILQGRFVPLRSSVFTTRSISLCIPSARFVPILKGSSPVLASDFPSGRAAAAWVLVNIVSNQMMCSIKP